jgi:hypothetical protein
VDADGNPLNEEEIHPDVVPAAAHVQSVDPDEELAKEGNQTVGHSSQYDYDYDDEDNEEPVTFLE